MEDDSQGMAYLIIGFLILIAVIVAIIFLINHTRNKVFNETPELQNYSYTFEIRAFDNGERVYGLAYNLSADGKVLQEGILEEGYKTEFKQVRNDTNYTLQIKSEKFYYDPTICTAHQEICSAQVREIAVPDIKVIQYPDIYGLLIYIKKGIYFDPGLCLQENSNRIYGLKAQGYEPAEMPTRFKDDYDSCYKLNDLNEGFTDIILDYNIDTSKDFRFGDRLKIVLFDLYNKTYILDIKSNDVFEVKELI